MTNITRPMTRRAAIQGAALAVGGLAGAALLGCTPKSSITSPQAGSSGTQGGGTGVQTLPLTAPVVSGTPKKGGIFTASIGATTYVQHDSHTQLGASEWHVISEKTIEQDPKTAELLPSVAASWEAADPNGLTLVFKVKPGIKIHNVAPWNGRDFVAQDLAWNIERIGALYAERLKIPAVSFQRSTMVKNLVKAEAVDNTTVKVTLSAPNSGLFSGLAENRVMLMPKEMDDIGYSDPMKFGGIGPYQMAEYTKDVRERYKRFDGYSNFRKDEPWFDEFAQPTIPDASSAIAAFASGQIQMISVPLLADAQTVQKAKPDANLYQWIDCNWSHLRPNMAYEPFKDQRVRRALFESIDYLELGNGAFGTGWGFQGALNVGFPEAWSPEKIRSQPGYNPDTKAKDRADAQKLMTAAGFPNGKGIDFEILFWELPAAPYFRENATRFQAQMTSTFPEMKVRLKPSDAGAYATAQAAGNFQMVSYVITSTPDPVLELTSQYRSDGSRNYGKYNNPELDALVDKSLAELKKDARAQLLDQFQSKFLTDWNPNFVVYANAARNIVQGNIGGFDKSAGTWFGYSTTTKVARWYYVNK